MAANPKNMTNRIALAINAAVVEVECVEVHVRVAEGAPFFIASHFGLRGRLR